MNDTIVIDSDSGWLIVIDSIVNEFGSSKSELPGRPCRAVVGDSSELRSLSEALGGWEKGVPFSGMYVYKVYKRAPSGNNLVKGKQFFFFPDAEKEWGTYVVTVIEVIVSNNNNTYSNTKNNNTNQNTTNKNNRNNSKKYIHWLIDSFIHSLIDWLSDSPMRFMEPNITRLSKVRLQPQE